MIPSDAADFAALSQSFQWDLPARCNMAVEACDRWADGSGRLALIHLTGRGDPVHHSFDTVKAQSARLARVLTGHGLTAGDRVAVLLPQRPETAFAHLAAWRAGMISLPLFTLFGAEALSYRLAHSGARAVVTDRAGAQKVAQIRDQVPDLAVILCVDGAAEGALDLPAEMARASDCFEAVETGPDDPGLILYTSGTTGPPKGALHAHRVLRGHMPGVILSHDLMPQPGDLFWTPADWAWIGGLFDLLMAAWFLGQPVLCHRMTKFDPEEAFALIRRHGVRNSFLPPTALKLMRQVPQAGQRFGPTLRSIACGGESLGAELLDWGRETFGLTINEFYGQTECNMIVSSCSALGQHRPGFMGPAVPGHRLAIVDEAGRPVPEGQEGAIAVHRPDPVMFLRYWRNPEATADKFRGDWMLTGDVGVQEEGLLRYVGRDDDVITSAGYRIGPGEIEDCLIGHPAVAMAAVIGVPDPLRTQAIKALVVLAQGHDPSDALKANLQDWVRQRLAAHEYPRLLSFVDSLPLTATGKVMRRVLRDQEAESG